MPTSNPAHLTNRRMTKIVATIGPASREPEMLGRLLEAGVDVCRINCSHASADGIRSDVSRIRRTATEQGRNVGILLDLQGPKIRTGKTDTPLELEEGDVLEVVMDLNLRGKGHRTGTTWPTMANDVKPGEEVLFADGALAGVVHRVLHPEGRPAEVHIRMTVGGKLGSNKGINLPQTDIKAPSLTPKDKADLAVGVAAGADFVALSFVRHAQDVRDLKAALAEHGRPKLPIIAKIEKPEAVENIDEILDEVAGIMVARGDLGVEIPLEQVPVVQKQLIHRANERGRLVITATQMLDSMERNPRPTRAESTDVANAILDGTDAVMLSGETAAGKYPVQSVEVMDRIAREVEKSPYLTRPSLDILPGVDTAEGTVCRAAAYASRMHARPLVVFTWSGHTARLAAKSRPPKGVIAICHRQTVCDQLSLAWGVVSLRIPVIERTDDLIAGGERAILDSGLLHHGQEVVVLAGHAPMRGATNMMKVEVIDGQSS